MKRIVTALLFVFMLCSGILLSACDPDNSNMSIWVDVQNVEILLGETPDNTAVVRVGVNNASDTAVVFDYDQTNIKITSKQVGNGVTEATIVAYRYCDVDVTVRGVAQNTVFNVKAIIPVSDINLKSQNLALAYSSSQGGSFQLSKDLLNFMPEGTNQTAVKFELVGIDENDKENIYINDSNILVLNSGLINCPSEITVQAISEAPNKSNIKTTFTITVVPDINDSWKGIYNADNILIEQTEPFEIIRAQGKSNSELSLIVKGPAQTNNNLKLAIEPIYSFGDKGLICDEIKVNTVEGITSYEFIFCFDFTKINSLKVGTDTIAFKVYYENYPTVFIKTNSVSVKTFDAVTKINYTVAGQNVGTINTFNVYNTYAEGVAGLDFVFTGIPTTATETAMILNAGVNSGNLEFSVNGSVVTLVNNEFEFESEDVVTVIAKTIISEAINVSVLNKLNPSVKVDFSLVTCEGVTALGFINEEGNVLANPSFYLENGTNELTNSKELSVKVTPKISNVNLNISTSGTNYELIPYSVGEETNQYIIDNSNLDYSIIKIKVQAVAEQVGSNTLTISTETGYEISCNINTFTRFNDVLVEADSFYTDSNIIGEIDKADNGELLSVVIKKGQSLPLVYSCDSVIQNISYGFSDVKFNSAEHNVYVDSNTYNTFEDRTKCETLIYEDTSIVLSGNNLRTLKRLSPISIGKTWVKIVFSGYELDDDSNYVLTSITKYILVEIYNPITSISVSSQIVELYPYNEVGEVNNALSNKTIVVTLNEGKSIPTYNIISVSSGNFDGYCEIESIKDANNIDTGRYKIFALSRFDEDNREFINPTTLRFSARNFNDLFTVDVNVKMLTPKRVTQITTTNIDESGIYLNVSDNNLKTIKILTDIKPADALLKDLKYVFIPDYGVPQSIISISDDGIVRVTGDIGGTGIIRIIPKDRIIVGSDGFEMYTDSFCKDIKIVVADGSSRETSIRVINVSEITNNNLHYTLLNDVTINENLFDSFNGGLYGKLEDSLITYTIKTNSCSIFNIIEENAVIKDIRVFGSNVSDSGIVANVNNGTISNVTIDINQNGAEFVASSINSDADFVGGLVGVNNGTIQSSSFVGSINATKNDAYVGGLVGQNNGRVLKSFVHFYNLSETIQTSFTGGLVGGLVGVMTGNSILNASYVYNYAKNKIDGNVLCATVESGSKISECFGYLGTSSNFIGEESNFASLENETLMTNSTIKDCYIIYDASDVKNWAAIITTSTGSNLFTTTNGDTFIYPTNVLGSRYKWNRSNGINFNFAYLNACINPAPLTSTDLENIKIQNTDLSVKEYNGSALMFVYQTQDALNTNEQNALQRMNSISFKDLFEIADDSGILVSSTDSNIIDVSNGFANIKNVGKTTLTINSKYDLTVAPKEITVYVVRYTSQFTLNYGDYELTNDSVLTVKNGASDSVQTRVKSEIILSGKSFALIQHDTTVHYLKQEDLSDVSIVSGSEIGNHVISSPEDITNIYFFLQISDGDLSQSGFTNEESTIINKLLRNSTKLNLTVKKGMGANSVDTVNVNTARIYPSDTLEFQTYIISDYENGGDESLEIQIFDANGTDVSSLFNIELNYKNKENIASKYKLIYNVRISVKDEFKSMDFDSSTYTIELVAKSDKTILKTISLIIDEQEISRIDYNHYAMLYSTDKGLLFKSSPTNVLSPNTTGMLTISVYPNYAKYDYITVTAKPVNGQSISLTSLKLDNGYFVINNSAKFEYIENGVKISKDETVNSVGVFYIKVQVPASVQINSVFDIEINAYSSTSETPVFEQETFSLIVIPQIKPGITINGQSTVYAYSGQELPAKILVDIEQTLTSVIVKNIKNGTVKSLIVSDAVVTEIGGGYLEYAITIPGQNASFKVIATSSRYVNGVTEYTSTEVSVYVVPFILDFENTTVNNADGNNDLVISKQSYSPMEFNFEALYGTAGISSFEEFCENGKFEQNEYVVNTKNSLKECLYYVNGNELTPVWNISQSIFENNNIIQFSQEGDSLYVIGKLNGTQNLRLIVDVIMPDSAVFAYTLNFTITVKNFTSEEKPETISTQAQFEEILLSGTGENYILTSDLVLYDYTPFANTSNINSLDGNGYIITIVNFSDSIAQNNTQNYALFETVSANTTLKNIKLNIYHLDTLNIDSEVCSSLKVAPLAIINNGIINNCEVVAFKTLINTVAPSVVGLSVSTQSILTMQSSVAGFVLENTGSISNSRVGGQDITTIIGAISQTGRVTTIKQNLPTFTISAKGEISGFVQSNKGIISSCFVDNARIINLSDSNYTTITSGFAKINSGTITMSYVKGVSKDDTEVHASRYGIETSGNSAGFVYQNANKISDCYTNITLTNSNNNPGRTSAGFVYQNQKDASINNCLSFSKVIGSTTTQMNFIGVDDYSEYQNYGTLTNSYYYDKDLVDGYKTSVEDKYGKSAVMVDQINNEDLFYGFCFNTSDDNANGVWKLTINGPVLISPNIITNSIRYVIPGDTTDEDASNDEDTFAYAQGYAYGSNINPIIIRTATEFNEVFGGVDRYSLKDTYDKNYNEVYGSYRLANNIDLSELSTQDEDYRLLSSKMTLSGNKISKEALTYNGKFDGNGLTISGLTLSDSSQPVAENFGLFASIEEGAMLINLNVVLGGTNKDDIITGINAKNVKYVGTIAGTVQNASVINVSIKSAYEGTNTVTVLGKNIVGGAVGRVIGDSYLFGITTQDISVTASFFPEIYSGDPKNFKNWNKYNRIETTSGTDNSKCSYAGGVVGVADYYTAAGENSELYISSVLSNDPKVAMLKVKGTMIISGGTVGGVCGFVGPATQVQDALFELSDADQTNNNNQQKLIAYNGFAGAIVGFSKGDLRQVRAEHELELQKTIEENIQNYYSDDETKQQLAVRGNMELFYSSSYNPIAVGGIAGLCESGKITKSYSKINVVCDNANYAGGIVGFSDTEAGSTGGSPVLKTLLEEVYALGNVRGKDVAGGIVGGGLAASMCVSRVNALNYWTKNQVNIYSFGKNDIFDVDETLTSGGELYDIDLSKISLSNLDTNKECKHFSFKEFEGISSDGTKIDALFFNNDNWSRDDWARDNDELLPHIRFGYSGKIFEIKVMADINLMRIFPDATFVIVGNSTNGGMVEINRNIPSISNFKGVLMGKDNTGKYGFKFMTNLTQPLFKDVTSAAFKDFKIEAARGVNFNINNQNEVGVLAGSATSTSFSNLKFVNVKLSCRNTTAQELNVGIMAGNIFSISSQSIKSISFDQCYIDVGDTLSDGKLNVGMLAGKLHGQISISDISILNTISDNQGINIKNNANDCELNIGGVVGRYYATDKDNKPVIMFTGSEQPSFKTQIIIDAQHSESIKSGLLAGTLNNVEMKESSEDAEKFNFDGKLSVTGSVQDIGGIVGHAVNSTIASCVATIDILCANIKNASSIGGAVGFLNNSTIKDVCVNKKENESQIKIDSSESCQNVYVGGLVGTSQLEIKIQSCLSYCDIIVSDITTATDGGNLYVGGLVGNNVNSGTVEILNSAYFGKIDITKSSDEVTMNIGGLLGNLISGSGASTIKECIFGGVIDFSNVSTKNVTLNCGGLVGYNGATNSIINDNLSYGDIFINRFNESSIVGISGVTTPVFVGGLLGNNCSSLEVNSTSSKGPNLSLTTLYNYAERNITTNDTYGIYSICGANGDNVTNGINEYCHAYNLTTIGTANDSSVNITVQDAYVKAKVMIEEYIGIEDIENSKIKPTELTSLNHLVEKEEKTYYYIPKGCEVEFTNNKGLELENTVILSDGGVIKNNDCSNSIFVSIDKDSYIAGLVVKTRLESIKSTDEIGFVGENNGIIYSCNALGLTTDDDKDISISSESDVEVSGFVVVNNGLIRDCFSHLDIVDSNSNGNKDSTYSNFCIKNNGTISNSYSSGSLDIPNNTIGYLFGKNSSDSGKMYDSYTIVKVVNLKNTSTVAFAKNEEDGVIESCVYDLYATERDVGSGSNTTDFLSINYNKDKSESNINDLTLSGIWGFDNTINYGYGTFNTNGYQDIAYMQEETCLYSEDQETITAYLVPNLGKLKQISSDNTKSYQITQDINAEVLEDFIWECFDFYGNLDGDSKTIENLKMESGLFNKVTGKISNLNLYKCITNISSEYTGALINILESETTETTVTTETTETTALEDNTINLTNINISNLEISIPKITSATTFGFIVGKNNGGNISDCSTSNNGSNRICSFSKGITVGGIVGEQVSGTINNCTLKGEFNIGSQTADSTVVFGGIAGIQKGGSITECNSNADLDILTTDKDIAKTLYVGGIVGKQTSGRISLCATAGDAIISGGNTKSVAESYVAGICAFGGYISTETTGDESTETAGIENCSNLASIVAHATVTENVEKVFFNDTVDFLFSKFTDYYNSIVFSNFSEPAHAGGIANHSNISLSINKGIVLGGVNKTALSEYNSIDLSKASATIRIVQVAFKGGSLLLKSIHPVTVGIGAGIILAGGIGGLAALLSMHHQRTCYQSPYAVNENGWDLQAIDYKNSVQATFDKFKNFKASDIGEMILNIALLNIESLFVGHYGLPADLKNIDTTTAKISNIIDALDELGNGWTRIKSKRMGDLTYYYNLYEWNFSNISSEYMEIKQINYGTIGVENNIDENVFTTTTELIMIAKPKELNQYINEPMYYLNEPYKINEDNTQRFAYSLGEGVTCTEVTSLSSLELNGYWTKEGELLTASKNKRTSPDDLYTYNYNATTNVLNIKSSEDLKGVEGFISNKISGDSLTLSIVNDINLDTTWTPISTKDNFNITINGNNNTINAYAIQSKDNNIGLFKNLNTLTVNKLTVEAGLIEFAATKEEGKTGATNVGILVGSVKKLIVDNVEITVNSSIKDYIEGVITTDYSKGDYNLGFLSGSVVNEFNIKSVKINGSSNGLFDTKNASGKVTIGGLIGNASITTNDSLIKNSSVGSYFDVKSNKSSINNVGGFIGELLLENNNLSMDNCLMQGKLQILSVSDTCAVGGIIGTATITSGKLLDLGSTIINVNKYKISADYYQVDSSQDTEVKLCAGGVVGLLSGESSRDGSIKVLKIQISDSSEYSHYNERTYIMAGMNSTYSKITSYAGRIVGYNVNAVNIVGLDKNSEINCKALSKGNRYAEIENSSNVVFINQYSYNKDDIEFKAELYYEEFPVQYSYEEKAQSFVDNNKFVSYNYKKTYNFNYITRSKLSNSENVKAYDLEEGHDYIYEYSLKVYQLNIYYGYKTNEIELETWIDFDSISYDLFYSYSDNAISKNGEISEDAKVNASGIAGLQNTIINDRSSSLILDKDNNPKDKKQDSIDNKYYYGNKNFINYDNSTNSEYIAPVLKEGVLRINEYNSKDSLLATWLKVDGIYTEKLTLEDQSEELPEFGVIKEYLAIETSSDEYTSFQEISSVQNNSTIDALGNYMFFTTQSYKTRRLDDSVEKITVVSKHTLGENITKEDSEDDTNQTIIKYDDSVIDYIYKESNGVINYIGYIEYSYEDKLTINESETTVSLDFVLDKIAGKFKDYCSNRTESYFPEKLLTSYNLNNAHNNLLSMKQTPDAFLPISISTTTLNRHSYYCVNGKLNNENFYEITKYPVVETITTKYSLSSAGVLTKGDQSSLVNKLSSERVSSQLETSVKISDSFSFTYTDETNWSVNYKRVGEDGLTTYNTYNITLEIIDGENVFKVGGESISNSIVEIDGFSYKKENLNTKIYYDSNEIKLPGTDWAFELIEEDNLKATKLNGDYLIINDSCTVVGFSKNVEVKFDDLETVTYNVVYNGGEYTVSNGSVSIDVGTQEPIISAVGYKGSSEKYLLKINDKIYTRSLVKPGEKAAGTVFAVKYNNDTKWLVVNNGYSVVFENLSEISTNTLGEYKYISLTNDNGTRNFNMNLEEITSLDTTNPKINFSDKCDNLSSDKEIFLSAVVEVGSDRIYAFDNFTITRPLYIQETVTLGASVEGLYELVSGEYESTSDTNAQEGKTYYSKTSKEEVSTSLYFSKHLDTYFVKVGDNYYDISTGRINSNFEYIAQSKIESGDIEGNVIINEIKYLDKTSYEYIVFIITDKNWTETVEGMTYKYAIKSYYDSYIFSSYTTGTILSYVTQNIYCKTTDTIAQEGKTYYSYSETYTEETVTAGTTNVQDYYIVITKKQGFKFGENVIFIKTYTWTHTEDNNAQSGKTYYSYADGIYTQETVTLGTDVSNFYEYFVL